MLDNPDLIGTIVLLSPFWIALLWGFITRKTVRKSTWTQKGNVRSPWRGK